MTITVCVFDMAGTTVDDGGLVYDALRGAVAETGASVDEADLQAWMGTEKREAIRNLVRLGGQEPAEDAVEGAYDRFVEILTDYYRRTPPTPLDGVPEALATLRGAGVKVALTTGFSRPVTTPLLEGLGWKIGADIDAVVTADEVAQGRPAPYMVHRAMERTGALDVAEVLVAGDTVADVVAGRRSGAAHSLGVLTGALSRERLLEAGATTVLDGVADVPRFLGLG